MEIWDGYFEDGTQAGIDLVRGEKIPQGLYHLVCEILVRHVDGDYLLMQRDFKKDNYPGFFEATAGGSALKGEDRDACAKRELKEETGITPEALSEIGRFVSKDTIYHTYLALSSLNKSSVRLQKGETVSYKWVSEAQFIEFVQSGNMIPEQKDRYRMYFSKMRYL
ncbi:MAG: NUDIX domain-containing protein [Clostridia bacterium]|nr:NUDIX domain-containing protein [Clostridia bacterium]